MHYLRALLRNLLRRAAVERELDAEPHAPIVLASAAAVFALVGLAACYVPLRRAVRIRATEALRYE